MSTTTTDQITKQDFKVRDITLADSGRKEISIAETRDICARPVTS
jgi:hypothetical protein